MEKLRPLVSVLIPVRNSELTLAAALQSVRLQDYEGPVEVIVADGESLTSPSAIVQREYPSARVISNPDRITPAGLNRALRASKGSVIVRCDAHTRLPPSYLRRVVETLARTGAANVGGRQCPIGVSIFERAVALAMISPLGSGNARYRIGGREGPTDTVYLGAFRRAALEAVGGYDTGQIRNQDYELNWRLRQQGETVWFDPELKAEYRPRGNLWELARQYFDYGRWKRVMLAKHPASVRLRQLMPPLLVLGLVASVGVGLAGFPRWALSVPLTYALALIGSALDVSWRRRTAIALLLPLIFAIMHLSWGLGFLLSLRPRDRMT